VIMTLVLKFVKHFDITQAWLMNVLTGTFNVLLILAQFGFMLFAVFVFRILPS
jgi:hypothetical protein